MDQSLRFFLMLVCCSAFGCGSSVPNYDGFTQALERATKATLLEGLPHPVKETELFEKESQSKETLTLLDEHLFYESRQDIDEQTLQRVCDVLQDSRFYYRREEPIDCGFHPDYCIDFDVDGESFRVFVCFGCNQLEGHGPESRLFCDITSEGAAALKKLLETHRVERPIGDAG